MNLSCGVKVEKEEVENQELFTIQVTMAHFTTKFSKNLFILISIFLNQQNNI